MIPQGGGRQIILPPLKKSPYMGERSLRSERPPTWRECRSHAVGDVQVPESLARAPNKDRQKGKSPPPPYCNNPRSPPLPDGRSPSRKGGTTAVQ